MVEDENELNAADRAADDPPAHDEPRESRVRWRKRDDGRARAAESGAAAPASAGTDDIPDGQRAAFEAAVEARMASELEKVEDAQSRLSRVQADFANYKRRSEAEREQQAKFATLLLVTELLPVLDNFDRALSTMPDHVRGLPWTEGLLLVDRQLRATLEKQGLKLIEAVGNRFDPMLHEAIIHEESDEYQDDQVIAELQRGYMLHDKVVRPTLVKVAKNVG